MSKSTNIFVKDAKTRMLLVGVGLLVAAVAVFPQFRAVRSGWSVAPEIVLLGSLSCAYISAFALTVGLWGGFPEWSHIFIPRALRELFMAGYKTRMAAQANTSSPYRWGSRLQVRLAQWAMVPLVGWLATQLDPLAAVFGRATGIIGACVGGILAVVLPQFLTHEPSKMPHTQAPPTTPQQYANQGKRPQAIEIFVKRIPTRIVLACLGLTLVWLTKTFIGWAVDYPPSSATAPTLLFGALMCAYVGAILLTIGGWGGLPARSRYFIPPQLQTTIRRLALLRAAQRRTARASPGQTKKLWQEAEEHALGYITLCDASGTVYDWKTLTANLKDHFPDLPSGACYQIALSTLGKSQQK